MPSITSQMPIFFANGAQWSEIKGECKGCGCELPDNTVRGLIVRHTPKMVSVEAVGVCHDCKLLTRFLYRLYDDMRITGLRDGKWKTWAPRPTVLERVRALIRI